MADITASVFTRLKKYRNIDISKEQYDERRYTYPKNDTTQQWAKLPSQDISDTLAEPFKDKLKSHYIRQTPVLTYFVRTGVNIIVLLSPLITLLKQLWITAICSDTDYKRFCLERQ